METELKKTEAQNTTQVTTAGFKNIIVQPRISEKASKLSESGKYVFTVSNSANKVEVKKAIEQSYKVTVTQVNMVVMKGKARTFGRASGRTSAFKKAIVTLKKGDTIKELEAA